MEKEGIPEEEQEHPTSESQPERKWRWTAKPKARADAVGAHIPTFKPSDSTQQVAVLPYDQFFIDGTLSMIRYVCSPC